MFFFVFNLKFQILFTFWHTHCTIEEGREKMERKKTTSVSPTNELFTLWIKNYCWQKVIYLFFLLFFVCELRLLLYWMRSREQFPKKQNKSKTMIPCSIFRWILNDLINWKRKYTDIHDNYQYIAPSNFYEAGILKSRLDSESVMPTAEMS